MVETTSRRARTTDEKIAVAGVVVSTANTIAFQLFAGLSVPINMIVYLVANGAPPPKVASAGESVRAQWLGNFGFIVPWWYFAASGLLTLAVAILALNPRWRFAPQSRKYFAYRTTPGFLAFVTSIAVSSQLGFSTYYGDWMANFGPYAIGTILCVLALFITLALYKFGSKSSDSTSRRRAAERTA